MQRPLFSEDDVEGAGLELDLRRGWIAGRQADEAFGSLLVEVPWEQHHITVAGRRSPVPRLEAWLGDPDAHYAYSGIALAPNPWTPTTARLRDRLIAELGISFNSVLANRYRDGSDSVAWHADDEVELGPDPVIAAVSVGASRSFQLKRRADPVDRRSIVLHHGDLLIMSGPTQTEWLHRVPRTTRAVGERISLTFRSIIGARP